jgi:U2 small nuclear ribonucleoprotein A'
MELEYLNIVLFLQDQFDTIDFSDNDIRKIDGFPYLPRLKTLILNNNRVV